MASIGDILRITQCGNLFDQQICNVFYYLVGAWTGNYDVSDIATQFASAITTPIAAQQSDSLNWGQVKVENLDNLAEVHTEEVDIDGAQTSTPSMPSYVASSMQLTRSTALTRHGGKRFAGVPEGHVTGNDIGIGAGYNTIEAAVASNLVLASSTDELEPVIVGRSPDGSLNLSAINPVASAVFSDKISTQNSRKFGHGD